MSKKEVKKVKCAKCEKEFCVNQVRLLVDRSLYNTGMAGISSKSSELFCIECANILQTANPKLVAIALGVKNE